jgi:hypothetical protein
MQMLNDEFPTVTLEPVLFATVMRQTRQLAGLGEPGEVQQLREFLIREKERVGGGAYRDHADDSNRCDAIFWMTLEMIHQFVRNG